MCGGGGCIFGVLTVNLLTLPLFRAHSMLLFMASLGHHL